MDALKAAVLQAEEDSRMRHTPLRQAFNALRSALPTISGGGFQKQDVRQALAKSTYISIMNMRYKDDVRTEYANERPVTTSGTISIPETEDVSDFTFRKLPAEIEVTCPRDWKITHKASLIQENKPDGAIDPIVHFTDRFYMSFPYSDTVRGYPHTDVITIEKNGTRRVFSIETRVSLTDLVQDLNSLSHIKY